MVKIKVLKKWMRYAPAPSKLKRTSSTPKCKGIFNIYSKFKEDEDSKQEGKKKVHWRRATNGRFRLLTMVAKQKRQLGREIMLVALTGQYLGFKT